MPYEDMSDEYKALFSSAVGSTKHASIIAFANYLDRHSTITDDALDSLRYMYGGGTQKQRISYRSSIIKSYINNYKQETLYEKVYDKRLALNVIQQSKGAVK